jgi:hypothetical protein
MAFKKLNQVLAVEKTVKAKREDQFTKIYRDLQKSELTQGLARTYSPKDDNGEKLPSESKKVQLRVEDAFSDITEAMAEVFNLAALKDATNCNAKADVVVDGETIVANVPATHLLWVEKKLASIVDAITKAPTLSQDVVWTKDEGQGLYRSDAVETVKTKKIEEHKVVIQPTKEHPGQFVKVTEDVAVGTWKTIHLSGAITEDRKKQLLLRVEKFQQAVKVAREEANQTPVVELSTAVIIKRIFAP